MCSVVHRSKFPAHCGRRPTTGIMRTVLRSRPQRATRQAGTALLTSLNTLFSEEDLPPGHPDRNGRHVPYIQGSCVAVETENSGVLVVSMSDCSSTTRRA